MNFANQDDLAEHSAKLAGQFGAAFSEVLEVTFSTACAQRPGGHDRHTPEMQVVPQLALQAALAAAFAATADILKEIAEVEAFATIEED